MKSCIFCNKQGRPSKEHIWPEWYESLHPKYNNPGHYTVSETRKGKPGVIVGRRLKNNQGDVITQKVRAVCSSCNNDWMSKLETEFKDIFLKLAPINPIQLTEREVLTVSRWVYMKSIVSEFHDNFRLTPICERLDFKNNFTIPSYVRIYASFHSMEEKALFNRNSAVFGAPDKPFPILPDGLTRNTHVICFVIGSLFFIVTACTNTDINKGMFRESFGLKEIHPAILGVNSGEFRILNSSEVRSYINSFQRFIERPQVLHRDYPLGE